MKNHTLTFLFCLLNIALNAQNTSNLEAHFKNPSPSVQPYVWWHWMGSNFSKSGITKDLEAMRASGIGGATIFNLASAVQETHAPTENNPFPHQTYRSPAYWEALQHAAAEAQRLGLEIGLHNTAGYSTTGGPWITEERAMQRLVWSKTAQEGGKTLSLNLSKPEVPIFMGWGSPKKRATFYKDIAVLAVPNDTLFAAKDVVDLTTKMDSTGQCQWAAPAGKWVIYRIGHAPTMANPHPLPDDIIGKSLEVDKMSAEQNRFHWETVLNPLKEKLGNYFGKSFKHLLIDSYEADFQDWTPAFREEFIKLKGYDPIPYLISFDVNTDKKHFIIDNKERTRRFKWDFQDVVNHLFFENGWAVGKNLMQKEQLSLQFEPYSGPFSMTQGVALADLPMGEFWTHNEGVNPNIAAAARAAGRTIVGAEAFTGRPEASQYTEDPAYLLHSALKAYSSGINRLILHHWVHQPFDDKYQPGMGMGWWGTHFGRHQTWFEQGKTFFKFLGRTQALLQYGEQVGDYLCFEKAVGFSDIISKNDFLRQNISVIDGKIVLETGRTYPFMVFSDSLMLPEVALKIKDLVQHGATIVAPKPIGSPSLKDYPNCDETLKKLGDEVWSNKESNQYGKGFIFKNIKDPLSKISISPDFLLEKKDSNIKIVHRKGQDADIYFIANLSTKNHNFTPSFRIFGKQPELWQAENGSISNAPVWSENDGRTSVFLQLKGRQTVFVVFRKGVLMQDKPISVTVQDTTAHYFVDMNKEGLPVLRSASSISATIQYASGKQKTLAFKPKPPVDITGSWQVHFKPKLDTPFQKTFPNLIDFSQHDDPSVKYFAGTAIYEKKVNLDKLKPNQRIVLDLGTLNDIAEVKINGKSAGVLWYPPYEVDVTDYVKKGENTLEIAVTNNWANRLIGDEQEPTDFEWGKDRGVKMGRAMKAYPDWFIKDEPRPSKERKGFTIWYYHRKDSPLQPAGLVGAVRLVFMEEKSSVFNLF